MESKDLIRDNLEKSLVRVLSKVEEMKPYATVFPTPNRGCHTLWILGHLAFIEGLVIHQFMLQQSNPVAIWSEPFDGNEVFADETNYPPFDEVLAKCRQMRRDTISKLDLLGEDDLDQTSASVPTGFEDMFGTYRLCFQYVSDHWYMHRGQLADARRAAGIDRMWY